MTVYSEAARSAESNKPSDFHPLGHQSFTAPGLGTILKASQDCCLKYEFRQRKRKRGMNLVNQLT